MRKLIDMFTDHANQTGNTTLSLAFAIGEQGLAALPAPNGCTATNVVNALHDFSTEIQT